MECHDEPTPPRERVAADFVLVTGCPRSGTYLVVAMLNAHPAIAMPVETHFLPLFLRTKRLWGDLDRPANCRRLAEAICTFLRIWTPRSERQRDPAVIRQYSLLPEFEALTLTVRRAASYSALVSYAYRAYADRHGAHLAGDKSAYFHAVNPDLLQACFKGRSKILHVVRDGRDVALSWLAVWFGPLTLSHAARAWRDHVRVNRRWGEENPESYLELRYEDLLGDPGRTLRDVCSFLGVNFTASMLEFGRTPLVESLAATGPHNLLNKPLNRGNRDKWRRGMTPTDRALFDSIAGDALVSCGYEVPARDCSFIARIRRRLRILASYPVTILSYRTWRLRSKALLPCVILICQWLGLRLDRILGPPPRQL